MRPLRAAEAAEAAAEAGLASPAVGVVEKVASRGRSVAGEAAAAELVRL